MPAASNKNLVLAAMVFAVAMTFIDQTIVAIAVPDLERDLSLSQTGAQWIINGYLLALAALFAFGGRLGDVLGRRRMVTIGVIGFAAASACCGLTPTSGIAEAWIVFFRVVQGAFAALLFPAAVGIVVGAFPMTERGKAMAIFFGVTGGLTALGPLAGGFLTQWTWRSIFWINIPVAIVALYLIWRSKPDDTRRPSTLDYRGTILISAGMGLLVLGLQQSSIWGWSSIGTWGCIVAGLALGAVFVLWELRVETPLLNLHIFSDRGFAVENIVLATMSVVFVPFFFFASVYAQAALGENASNAGFYIMYFFLGFVITAQIGGRILDKRGARPSVVLGCALGAVGFFLLAGKLTDLSLNAQIPYLLLAGGGVGLILGPASTDALNRAPSSSYSEVTGITQTSRNFGASLGLAVLGTLLISRNDVNVTDALVARRRAARAGARGGHEPRLRRRRGARTRLAEADRRGPVRVRGVGPDRVLRDGRGPGGDVPDRAGRAARRPHGGRRAERRAGAGPRAGARLGGALARAHRDRQPVGRRRQRARPARVVGAGRVVGDVEVEHEPPVVGAQVRALDRVEQVAAGAVGLAPARRIAERDEQAAAVRVEPVEVEPELLAAERERRGAEADERHRLARARVELEALRLGGRDGGGDARGRVVGEPRHPAVAGTLLPRERRLGVLPEQLVARRAERGDARAAGLRAQRGVEREDAPLPVEELELGGHAASVPGGGLHG